MVNELVSVGRKIHYELHSFQFVAATTQHSPASRKPAPAPLLKKKILDISPNIAHIILHPHPMRDRTRAVEFGWVGSGSRAAGYRSLLPGRSLQKAGFTGWPPVNKPMASQPSTPAQSPARPAL